MKQVFNHRSISNLYQTNESFLPVWRSRLIVFLLFILFSALLLRGLWIQWFNNDFYEAQANKRIEKSVKIFASRGKILDRNNNNLAVSLNKKAIFINAEYLDKVHVCKQIMLVKKDIECKKIALDIKRIQNLDEKLIKLSELLKIDIQELNKKIARKATRFIYLKHFVEEDIATQINQLNIPGLGQETESKRYYTHGEAMAQLVGRTNFENKGQEGLELSFESSLTGQNGQARVIHDRFGNVVDDKGTIKPAISGQDLVLSIDSYVQTAVYNALKEAVQMHKAKLGTAVVLDAKTGETLAMANWPSYNPNSNINPSGDSSKNHALTDVFEPGSTMKPLIVSSAMDKGLINENTVFNVSSLNISGKNITDSHQHSRLSTLEIIQKSSNIGTVKIANLMNNEEQWNVYHQLGLGQTPSLNFPGTASGYLRNFKLWRPIEKATMSYGYGLSSSIFQLAQAYTIFANEGKFISATLLKRDISEVVARQVISPQATRSMLKGLEMATEAGGTAVKAQILGYRVGGKTGTAHKQIEGGKGYSHNTYRAFFVGLVPISQPRLIVAIMVDEPSNGEHYGGQVSAPIFAKVAEVTLRVLKNVPMDKPIELDKKKLDKPKKA
jgi:cell division protein FtsI (penicillin-binding protein 3)